MSYKIEITASTTVELAGKLLALAASMQQPGVNVAAADPVMTEVKDAAKPKKAKAEKPVEVAEAPAGEPPISERPATTSDTTSSTARPSEAPEEITPEAAASATPEPAEGVKEIALDFDKDVAPVVLKAVAKLGKPWVQDVLSQFGVERASQVPDAQFGELVSIITEALKA